MARLIVMFAVFTFSPVFLDCAAFNCQDSSIGAAGENSNWRHIFEITRAHIHIVCHMNYINIFFLYRSGMNFMEASNLSNLPPDIIRMIIQLEKPELIDPQRLAS